MLVLFVVWVFFVLINKWVLFSKWVFFGSVFFSVLIIKCGILNIVVGFCCCVVNIFYLMIFIFWVVLLRSVLKICDNFCFLVIGWLGSEKVR